MSCATLLLSSDRVARSAATSACEGSSRQPIPRGIAAESAATPTLQAARRRLAPGGEAQARRLLERSQTLSSAPAVLVERAQLLDQRGADLLPNDAIEAGGVLAQLLE